MNLILFGFKCAGKTYMGKLLAEKLNRAFIDTDQLLENKHHLSVRELYQRLGEAGFRAAEDEVVCSLTKGNAVIALGGGAVLREANVLHLQSIGKLIYLDTPFEIIEKRILPSDLSFWKKLYQERKSIYESIPAERVGGF